MKLLCILLTTLIASLSFGQAKLVFNEDKAKSEHEILAIENQIAELYKKSDFKGLAELVERISTDNCTAVHGSGYVETNDTAVKNLREMAAKKDSNLTYEAFRMEDKKVDVYRDAAVFSAKAIWRTQGGAKAGKAPAEALFSHFFVKQDGEWELAKIHITDIPAK